MLRLFRAMQRHAFTHDRKALANNLLFMVLGMMSLQLFHVWEGRVELSEAWGSEQFAKVLFEYVYGIIFPMAFIAACYLVFALLIPAVVSAAITAFFVLPTATVLAAGGFWAYLLAELGPDYILYLGIGFFANIGLVLYWTHMIAFRLTGVSGHIGKNSSGRGDIRIL